ncbi:MAG TPA: phosphoribosylanthranilate isomerase [Thermoanaerobaculia bacterium]|nr:phosphoribosylanthranilate isomerase [Thermoanaerobaculia bacterium]
MRPIVQIAGIANRSEVELLIAAGVDWLGFPLRLDLHREDLCAAEAARIIRSLRPPHEAVLITYLRQAAEIVAFCRELGVRRVQLHGPIARGELAAVKTLAPGLFVIKSLVIQAKNQGDLEAELRGASPYVDAFLTDTYDPATGASGATGKTHDWAVSRKLVEISPLPVILAGGLTPANVAQAIREVRPAGVDAHTGVEGKDGAKDPQLVHSFVARARRAFAALLSTEGR